MRDAVARLAQGCAMGLVAAVLAGCGGDAPAPGVPAADGSTRVALVQGEVTGFLDANGARVWLGLPYAAPPVGELRWRAPRPPLVLEAPLEAVHHGARCPQITNELSAAEGFEPGLLIGSEDCLFLDIYAPADARAGSDLPVMMWIHGGSNTWGSATAYDGAQLAQDQNVIVIAVQYRLGPLGFLSHPELRASAQVPEDEAANFALLDLVAALDWIGGNIAGFGGDPGNITIFGESAGAYNIAGLMASPAARGRFHRAIMQSGGTASLSREMAEAGGGLDANPALEAVARFAGAGADADAMRAVSVEAVFAAYRDADGDLTSLPRMIEDGISLPEDGILGAAARPDGFAPVPLITGTNHDEMKLYLAFDPRLTRRLGPLLWTRDRDAYDAASEYPSRMWRINAVDTLLGRLADAGRDDIWAYRFDWDEGGRVLVSDTSVLLGASHGMEIPFVFNHFELFGSFDSVLFNDRNAEGREAVAAAMGAYWAAFARSGEPGAGDGRWPHWQSWDEGGWLMRFDTPADGGVGGIEGVDSAARVFADLAVDSRIDLQARCAIAAGLVRRQPELSVHMEALPDC